MTGHPAVRPSEDDLRTQDRVAELRAAQDEVDAEVLAGGYWTYEVPAFVAARYPSFDPADPSTWPEPDRCTEGRPWGSDAYGSVWGDPAGRWQRYLAEVDSPRNRNACRNRWKHEDSRLCGVHDRPWRDARIRSIRRQAARARELRHLDLAKRLGAYGIVADGTAHAVTLQADAVEQLLGILADADRLVSVMDGYYPRPVQDALVQLARRTGHLTDTTPEQTGS